MTVTWRDVAQKDFEDAVRSRLLWGLTIAFIGLMRLFLLVYVSTEGGDIDPLEALVFLGFWSQFFVPLIALIVGYMSIVGERQSGSLRILMSYPFTRKAILWQSYWTDCGDFADDSDRLRSHVCACSRISRYSTTH